MLLPILNRTPFTEGVRTITVILRIALGLFTIVVLHSITTLVLLVDVHQDILLNQNCVCLNISIYKDEYK